MNFSECATLHGKILSVNVNRAAINFPIASDHAITWDSFPFAVGSLGGERFQLPEGSRVQQQVQPLACGQASFGMLFFLTNGAASLQRGLAHLPEFFQTGI